MSAQARARLTALFPALMIAAAAYSASDPDTHSRKPPAHVLNRNTNHHQQKRRGNQSNGNNPLPQPNPQWGSSSSGTSSFKRNGGMESRKSGSDNWTIGLDSGYRFSSFRCACGRCSMDRPPTYRL
ncbi:hypothetical protein CC1G_15344 [Coprinopsis cinerea okayama7|uniref:Secreted protein n=1 Tax=Coprinopsis cinerea (strain Okayama-7 / 130 / ATCC MYA-4618 / FGSC 9003) TaxID=240176 RepID=D6RQ23_COPC7|nr:hypothetical protein CC1G_15344 [Coprinopsis cinerea okayama7\|eukprot:XP_002910437.1 hypothetical protein CC1G_15344 [Coprinopsis cinerea okayama7\